MGLTSVDIDNLQGALNYATDTDADAPGPQVSTDGFACREWIGLVEEYSATVKAFNDATAELPGSLGQGFNRAWLRAEGLRQISNAVRAALFEHEHRHGCLVARNRSMPPSVLRHSD